MKAEIMALALIFSGSSSNLAVVEMPYSQCLKYASNPSAIYLGVSVRCLPEKFIREPKRDTP